MTVTCIKENTPLGGGHMTPQEARAKIAAYDDHEIHQGLRAHLDKSWVKITVTPATLMYFRNWYRGMYNEGKKRGLDMSDYPAIPPHKVEA